MELIKDRSSAQGQIFNALKKLENIRRDEVVFSADAEVWTKDYSDQSILWIVRRYMDEELHAVFNFSDNAKTVWMPEKAEYMNLFSGSTDEIETVDIPEWGFLWMKKR